MNDTLSYIRKNPLFTLIFTLAIISLCWALFALINTPVNSSEFSLRVVAVISNVLGLAYISQTQKSYKQEMCILELGYKLEIRDSVIKLMTEKMPEEMGRSVRSLIEEADMNINQIFEKV